MTSHLLPIHSSGSLGSTTGSSVASADGSSTAASSITAGYVDPRWTNLWQKLHPFLLDPADVHSTIDELMGRVINRLSATEVTFLQRKVRSVTNVPRDKRITSDTGIHRAKDASYLLSQEEIKNVLPSGAIVSRSVSSASPPTTSIDPSETSYLLMLHLNQSLWDRVGKIALQSSQKAGLELDLCRDPVAMKATPFPSSTSEEPPALPAGASFHSLVFLVALALRGTRNQRLQLLFYLMLPPDLLLVFLKRHPAGGIPSWLIEVGSETILSLASLSHYHHFGDSFLPGSFTNPARLSDTEYNQLMRTRTTSLLKVSAEQMMTFLLSLLETHPTRDEGASPVRTKRQSTSTVTTNIMERLMEVSADNGKQSITDDPYLRACRTRLQKAATGSSGRQMNMADFYEWANGALNDVALDAIMIRLFSAGVIPTASLELEVVTQCWRHWQDTAARFLCHEDPDETSDFRLQNDSLSIGGSTSKTFRKPFGGIGGFDGRGAMGYGVMYAVDRRWWEFWEAYSGWKWYDDRTVDSRKRSRQRPWELSSEYLLNHLDEKTVSGTLGSYELMKNGLKKGLDYVLIPPEVWDILFELYGGGPPLPRIVLPPNSFSRTDLMIYQASHNGVLRIPKALSVETHPWVIHVRLCNPEEPYKEEERGLRIITVMCRPDQPLWRVYSECVARLSCNDGNIARRSRARLWKRDLDSDLSLPYGSWALLCKNRFAILPSQDYETEFHENCTNLTENWQAYAFFETVESVGVKDGSHLMMEYAVVSNKGELEWPREAAAKADSDRRAAEIDVKFRRLLRGKDDTGNSLPGKVDLIGMLLDAKDASGQWTQASISDVRILGNQSKYEINDFHSNATDVRLEDMTRLKRREIKIDFQATSEWIDVDSDRLALVGKFSRGKQRLNGSISTPRKPSRGRPDGDSDAPTRPGATHSVLKPNEASTPRKMVDSDDNVAPGRSSTSRHSSGESDDDSHAPTLPATAGLFQTKPTPALISRGRPDSDSDKPLFSRGQPDSDADEPIVSRSNSRDSGVSEEVKSSVHSIHSLNEMPRIAFPGYGGCGLANLGSSGCINSAVQCISHLPLLRSYLLSGQYKVSGDLNIGNHLVAGATLLEELVSLLRHMWSATTNVIAPSRFRDQIGRSNVIFQGTEPQDVKDFLDFFLNIMHEEINRVRKKPYVERIDEEWMAKTNIRVVGDEAWRRFLRRHRSAMVDLTMGQLLNSITCPVCNFSSRSFSTFNMLSVPLPNMKDVFFRCAVVRRADAFNSPWVLNRPRRGRNMKTRFTPMEPSPELQHQKSGEFVVKEYIIALPGISDIDELKVQIHGLCGISPDLLKLCYVEDICLDGRVGPPLIRRQTSVTPLTGKEGPCSHIVRQANAGGGVGSTHSNPLPIVAFECTLRSRPYVEEKIEEELSAARDGTGGEEATNMIEREEIKKLVSLYGNGTECRLYDTEMLPIAKAISRSLWPRSEVDFRVGLRLDAKDHTGHWYPGTVVDIVKNRKTSKKSSSQPLMVRVHFDNFSPKWDEKFTIDHFRSRVRPLYSRASPRTNSIEFLVHHRYTDRRTKKSNLFGQSFCVECQSEWSTARAAAHIISQASRFLAYDSDSDDAVASTEAKIRRLYDRSHTVISDLVDKLIDFDRQYVQAALGVVPTPTGEPFRNPDFDSSDLTSALLKRLGGLFHRLPFELRVCADDSPLGEAKDEVNFPFALERTIGNYMNARLVVVLRWRAPPSSEKNSPAGQSSIYLNAPVMYVEPTIFNDITASEIAANRAIENSQNKNSGTGSEMRLGSCLTEFCKVEQVSISDCWRCRKCRNTRDGRRNSSLWRLPDLLSFHLKRSSTAANWKERITSKVNFPLTGLDMTRWCHKESSAICNDPVESFVYDLVGVVNEHDNGQYNAVCRATACGQTGQEEVSRSFHGTGTSTAADALASSEPLWLQFDDDVVQQIPAHAVVKESASVLFYRRRRLSPANVARYTTLK